MRFRSVAVFILGGIALVFAAWLTMPTDQTVATLTESVGYIERGDKFGVRVGMSVAQAEDVLFRRGWDPMPEAGTYAVTECIGRQAVGTQRIRLYFDDSWRNGALCVIDDDRKVVGLGWSFMPLTP